MTPRVYYMFEKHDTQGMGQINLDRFVDCLDERFKEMVGEKKYRTKKRIPSRALQFLGTKYLVSTSGAY